MNRTIRCWRAARILQRLGFWALVLECAKTFLELFAPSDGGVGGFLMIVALLFLGTLTYLSFCSAVWLWATSEEELYSSSSASQASGTLPR